MESVVVAFPSLAAWLIVAIGAALIGLLLYGGKQVLARLGAQDKELAAIRLLLANEFRQLREMQHQIDLRVTKIEAGCTLYHMHRENGL